MDITCPQCKTEYEFDDDKVTEAGITVKCTNCNYMFKVRRKAVVETVPVTQPPASADAEDDRRWMIRTQSGQMYRFQELTTLQQWIVERKVSRDDQISRSGDTWKRLGDIAELGAFFQVVDAARAAASSTPSGPTVGPSHAPAQDEPAFSSNTTQFHDVGPSAAWEENGSSLSGAVIEDEFSGRHTGRTVSIVVLVLVLLGGGATAFMLRDRIGNLFSAGGERSDQAYQAGRKLLLMDDEQSLVRADQQFGRAPAGNGLALAARAEVFAIWAQHLREEATILEHKARRIEDAPQATPDPRASDKAPPAGNDDPAVVRLEAAKLRDEASRKLLQSETHASAALKVAAGKGEVKRAMADYLRMQGRHQQAQTYLDEARKLIPDDPECLYVEGAMESDLGHAPRAEGLLTLALSRTRARYGQSLLRAALLLGLLEMKAGRMAQAKAHAEDIIQVNPSHRWARLLLTEVTASRVSTATAAAIAPDAGAKPRPPDAASAGASTPPATPPLTGGYDAMVQQGNQLSERGRTMQALKAFERGLQLKPDGVEALTGLGYCHLDQERFSSATANFMKALRYSPTYGEALIGMAEAFKVQGNQRKALDYYRAYVTAHPSGNKAVMARHNVVDLERKLGFSTSPTSTPDPTPSPTPGPTPTPDPAPAPAPGSDPSPSAPAPPPPSPPAGVPEKDVPSVPGNE